MPIMWDRLSANVGIKSVRTFALRPTLILAVTRSLLSLPSVIPQLSLQAAPPRDELSTGGVRCQLAPGTRSSGKALVRG
jgi:hypothetical protein